MAKPEAPKDPDQEMLSCMHEFNKKNLDKFKKFMQAKMRVATAERKLAQSKQILQDSELDITTAMHLEADFDTLSEKLDLGEDIIKPIQSKKQWNREIQPGNRGHWHSILCHSRTMT